MDIVQIEIRQDMIKTMEILKNENSYVKSEIEGELYKWMSTIPC